MGLCDSGRPVTVMSVTASRDSAATAAQLPPVTFNGNTSSRQCSESAGDQEQSVGGGGAARVRRKRRHTCPDPRQSPPPLVNGWHGGGGRLSPPLRLGGLEGSLGRLLKSGSRRSSEGDGSSRLHDRPAKLARLELSVGRETANIVRETVPDKPLMNNGDRSDEPPVEDGESKPKDEPPDRASASPPPSPPPPSPPPPPPPPPAADGRKRNITETEKLYLNSECHKTEILSSKLRHTACRLSGAAAAVTFPAAAAAVQPPVLMPNGDEPAAKKRRRGPAPRRRRLSSVESPLATDSESDGPPHLEPEAPLAAAPCGGDRGTPAPQLQEAESEADAVSFSFQAAPDAEEWFRTFSRQEEGRRAVEDFSWAAAGGGQQLPYQMSVEELFPPELVPGGGRPRPLKPPTLPDRWLPPLPVVAGMAGCSAGESAPPPEWLCLEELCRVLHEAADSAEPSPAEVAPLAAEVTAALTAWPAHASLPELVDTLDGLPAELPELAAAEWSGPDTASEPSRPPSSADDASSVSTDASTSGSGRRRPMKRRKNRTGWPRARVRKSNLLKTAVSRAAAEAGAGRNTPGPS